MIYLQYLSGFGHSIPNAEYTDSNNNPNPELWLFNKSILIYSGSSLPGQKVHASPQQAKEGDRAQLLG